MLNLSVCDGTSCDGTGSISAAAEFEIIGASISAILNVDKEYIGTFLDDENVPLVGAGGGSNSILSGTEDQAIISQFNLKSGSVASFLGLAFVTAVTPFVAAYIFLVVHQAWLRQRVAKKSRPAAAAVAPGEGSLGEAEEKRDRSAWTVDTAAQKSGKVLLAGVGVIAFVIFFPVLAFRDGGKAETLPEFEEGITAACPGCINGLPTTEYLVTAPITTASRFIRQTIMEKAAWVREITVEESGRARERDGEMSFLGIGIKEQEEFECSQQDD